MKKFLIVFGLCIVGLNFAPTADAANFSISIGGPPLMVYGGGIGYGYSVCGAPCYNSGIYFSTGSLHHYGHHRPPHHGFSHRPSHGGGMPPHHMHGGGHGGHR